MLPSILQRYFWDAPFQAISSEAHKPYVIARILELGDEPAVRWLVERYSIDDLRTVVENSRGLSAKSRNYWKLRYHFE